MTKALNMKNIATIAKRVAKITSENSPVILTAIGVTGTLATAYLTGKATFKAAEIIKDEQYKRNITRGAGESKHELTAKEKVKLTWLVYLPAASTVALTVTAIIFANRIGTRRTAAMAAAYTFSERAFSEYKDKVVEHMGREKEEKVREEIAQDRVNRSEAPGKVLVVTSDDQVLCHDAWSNQYFHSDMETIRKAVNDINQQILHSDFATITDFYNAVDADMLEPTTGSSDFGWNTDRLLEVEYTTTLYRDKTPCLSITFATAPLPNPWRYV